MISFKLMRPGWIPATLLRNAGKGKAPGVISCKHGRPSLSTKVILQSEPS